VAASFYGWMISRIHVPGRGYLGFTGKPLDIWYVFVGLALMTYIGGALDIPFELRLVSVAGLSVLDDGALGDGQSHGGRPAASAQFRRQPMGLYRLYLLLAVSFITIIGWAWVIVYWMRWICSNIGGTRRAISFNATGLGFCGEPLFSRSAVPC
jgi:hypothetical protein